MNLWKQVLGSLTFQHNSHTTIKTDPSLRESANPPQRPPPKIPLSRTNPLKLHLLAQIHNQVPGPGILLVLNSRRLHARLICCSRRGEMRIHLPPCADFGSTIYRRGRDELRSVYDLPSSYCRIECWICVSYTGYL
jgi:hypothetical protein